MKDEDYRVMYAKDCAEVAAMTITTREDALYEFIFGVLIENPNSLWMSEGDVVRYAQKQFPTVELQMLVRATKRARVDFLVTPLALERQLITTKSTSDVALKFEPDAPRNAKPSATTTAAKVVSGASKVPRVTVEEALNKFEKVYTTLAIKWIGRAAEVAAAEAEAERGRAVPAVAAEVAAAHAPAVTDDEHQVLYDAHRKKTEATVARRAKAAAAKIQRARSGVRAILQAANVDADEVDANEVDADVAPIKKTRQRRPAKVKVPVVVAAEVAEVAAVAVAVDDMDDLINDYNDYLDEQEQRDEPTPAAVATVVEIDDMDDLINDYLEEQEREQPDEPGEPDEPDEYDDNGFDQLVAEYDAGVPVVTIQRPITLTLPFTPPDPEKLLWADGSSPVLTEVIDTEIAKKIYDNFSQLIAEKRLDVSLETVKLLPRFYKKFIGGEFKVRYYQLDFGRFYARGSVSLGCIQRAIRGSLTAGMMDLDIVNCHASIAHNLCVQNSIPCPLLSQYVKCRESFIKSIPVRDGEEPVTKHTIAALLNGNGCKTKGLTAFKKELRTIVDRVFFLFPEIRGTVASDAENRRAKVCSRVWMMVESHLQRMAMKIFQDAGFVIRVSVYDGFMIDKHATLPPEVLLRECERQIFEATGYSITFSIKPLPTVNFDGFVPNRVRTYLPRSRVVGTYAKYKPIIHDEFQVQPFFTRELLGKMVFSPGVRVVGICAPMGSGKSHQVRACLNELSLGKPQFKCLDVSSRRTQGAASRAAMNEYGYGFESYMDGNFDADRLTIQFESIHKVPVEQVFDLLILDEIRSILDCSTSSTNKDKWEANIAALRNLVLGSKRVVMCDADMLVDDAVSVMLDEFFPDPACVELHIYPRTHPDYIKRVVIRDQTDVLDSLRQDIRDGKRVGVVSPLRQSVQYIDQLAQHEDVKVKYFHGLSDESEKVVCWTDPDGEFDTTQVVVFNSAVTVGNDIQLPFDQLYVLADSARGCNFRQFTQMMGRFRRLKSVDVQMSFFGDCVDYVPSLTDANLIERDKGALEYALQKMVSRRNELISHFTLKRDADGARWCPDWVLKVRAHNEVLANINDFKQRFVEHQLFRGMTVVDSTSEPEKPAPNLDLSLMVSELTTYHKRLVLYKRVLLTKGKEASDLEISRVRNRVMLNEDEVVMVDMWRRVKPFVFVNQDTGEMRFPDSHVENIDDSGVTEVSASMPETEFIDRHSDSLLRLLSLIMGFDDDPGTFKYADQSGSILYRRALVGFLRELAGSDKTNVAELLREKHVITLKAIGDAEGTARALGVLVGAGSPRTLPKDESKHAFSHVNHVLKYFCVELGSNGRKRGGKGVRENTYDLKVLDAATGIVDRALDERWCPLTDMFQKSNTVTFRPERTERSTIKSDPVGAVPPTSSPLSESVRRTDSVEESIGRIFEGARARGVTFNNAQIQSDTVTVKRGRAKQPPKVVEPETPPAPPVNDESGPGAGGGTVDGTETSSQRRRRRLNEQARNKPAEAARRKEYSANYVWQLPKLDRSALLPPSPIPK
jgi:hypothetical protein